MQKIPLKYRQWIWKDVFPKQTFSWPTSPWENGWNHLNIRNMNQKHSEMSPRSHLEVTIIKKTTKKSSVSKAVEELEPTAGRDGGWVVFPGKQFGVSFKSLTWWCCGPSHSTPRYGPQRTEKKKQRTQTKACTQLLLMVLFMRVELNAHRPATGGGAVDRGLAVW